MGAHFYAIWQQMTGVMMQILNFVACGFLFGFCLWAVLWPQFKDGVLMKAGLVLIGLNGFAGLMHYYIGHLATPQAVLYNVAFALWALAILSRRIRRPAWSHR